MGIARGLTRRNLANIVSILGVLPLAVLFLDDGFVYIVPLMIFNNVMDDLDGIVANKLNIKGDFGAALDNVCDLAATTIFVLMNWGSLRLAQRYIRTGSCYCDHYPDHLPGHSRCLRARGLTNQRTDPPPNIDTHPA